MGNDRRVRIRTTPCWEKAAAETAGLAAHRSEALKAAEAEAATEKPALLAEAQAEADKLRAVARATTILAISRNSSLCVPPGSVGQFIAKCNGSGCLDSFRGGIS
jgi:hypothetical protein